MVFHPEYGKIAKNAVEAAIGGYHYDYLGKQKLPSFTVDGICHYLGGCATLVTVKRILKELTSSGWLNQSKLSSKEAKELVCQKQPQCFVLGALVCEWCKARTLILDTHHYPIPKSEGGEKTVKICPNCHQEFHQLVRATSYHPSENLIRFFKELAI
ncbi:MAG: hypothetical protein KME30_28805 [Iphinoe sp. HA4291-MV1]|nr:hypothetical protein [Iphinoe sp. HA4291-MV1]